MLDESVLPEQPPERSGSVACYCDSMRDRAGNKMTGRIRFDWWKMGDAWHWTLDYLDQPRRWSHGGRLLDISRLQVDCLDRVGHPEVLAKKAAVLWGEGCSFRKRHHVHWSTHAWSRSRGWRDATDWGTRLDNGSLEGKALAVKAPALGSNHSWIAVESAALH